MSNGTFAVALHGGAGASRRLSYDRELQFMDEVLRLAQARLGRGAAAVDIVTDAVASLEDSGLFVAGRGASPNRIGDYELDAAIMNGASGRAGAVACLRGFRNPIRIARLVSVRTPHVLLAGEGAESFAKDNGAERIDEPSAWYMHAASGESNHISTSLPTGTVGCVALDQEGRLAAASSTSGLFGKLPGRVSDTPVIGAGCWADSRIAVCCTGQGEYFIQGAIAARLGFAVESGEKVDQAAEQAIAKIGAAGGEGGLIAIDHCGHVAMPFNAEGMKRGYALADGTVHCAVFD